MGLGNLIENAVKLLKEEQDTIRNMENENGEDDEDLFNYDKEIVELTDEDYIDFSKEEELQAALDADLLEEYTLDGEV